MDAQERFWSHVEKAVDGCWYWKAHINNGGYGTVKWARRTRLAHRISYLITYGYEPKDLQLDHLCRHRSCVNPEHLEPVTCMENIHRGETGFHFKQRTHCAQGHEYTPENTRIVLTCNRRTYGRCCKECDRMKHREKYIKKSEVAS